MEQTSSASTYKKRSGVSAIKGQWFEIKLIMFIIIKAIISGFKFTLANNMEIAADFDDIVANFEYVQFGIPMSKTVFLQAKHVESPEKNKITLKDLKQPKNKFSMLKYFSSYEEIVKNHSELKKNGFNLEEAEFIVYTNTDFDESASDLFEECESNRVLDMLRTSKACPYRIKSNNIKIFIPLLSKSKYTIKNATIFLEKVIFLVKQGNQSKVEKKIKKCIQHRFDEHNDEKIHDNYSKSYEGYQDWWLIPDNVAFLTHENDLFLLYSSIFVHKQLKKYKFNLKLEVLGKEIELSDEYLCKFAEKVVQNRCLELKNFPGVNLLNVALLIQFLSTYKNNRVMFVDNKLMDKYDNEIIHNFQHSPTTNTIVMTFKKISTRTKQNLLKLFKIVYESKHKLMIILHDQKNALTEDKEFSCVLELNIKFQDLSAKCQEKVLGTNINFHGKNISIQNLCGKNVKKILNGNLLANVLLTDNLQIEGYQNEKPCVWLYIPRKFYNMHVNHNIIKHCASDYLLIVMEDKYNKKSKLFKGLDIAFYPSHIPQHKNIYFLLDKNNSSVIFKEICNKNKENNVHMLTYVDQKLKWVRSKGSAKSIRKYLTEYYIVNETELVKCCNNEGVIAISDIAGMGKTTVLKSLASIVNDLFPELWILNINLSDMTTLLYDLKYLYDKLTVKDRFINSLKFASSFNKTLFLSMFEAGQIAIFLDGFDEISPTYEKTVIKLVKNLKDCNIRQIYITSRPHMCEYIEENLNILVYKFLELNSEEQSEFMYHAWHVNQESECIELQELRTEAKKFIGMISTLTSKQDIAICGIPLQLWMLVQQFPAYNIDVQKHIQSGKILINIGTLYKSFVRHKIELFCKGNGIEPTKTNFIEEFNTHMDKAITFHQLLGIELLFKQEELNILLSEDQIKLLKQMKQNSHELTRYGIIAAVNFESTQFIHRTFAEYLSASFLCEKLEKSDCNIFLQFLVRVILMDSRFQLLRTFINYLILNSNRTQKILSFKRFSKNQTLSFFGINKNENPLHVAAKENNLYLIKYLVSGLKPKSLVTKRILNTSSNNSTVLYLLTASSSSIDSREYIETMEFIITYGAKLNQSRKHIGNLLNLAAGNQYVLQNFLNCFSNINKTNLKNETLVLHEAVKFNNITCVRILIRHNINVNIINRYGETAIHLAARLGYLDIVQCLVENGANLTFKTYKKESVLLLATLSGNLNLCKYLILHGADCNVKDAHNEPLILLAAREDKFDILKCLLKNGADVNFKNAYGVTLLHLVALKGEYNLVELLLELRAKINEKDNSGDSVLHWAMYAGNLEIVKLLVQFGADINSKNNHGESVIKEAVVEGHEDLLLYMMENNVNVNTLFTDEYSMLHFASWYGFLKIVTYLVNKGVNVNSKCKNNKLPIHFAAQEGHVDIIITLLKNNGDVNAKTIAGKSVLHFAAKGGHLEAVKLLIENGAEVNVQNNQGKSSLFLAAEQNHLKIVHFLLKFGANINVKDKNGNLYLHLAAKRGWLDIVLCFVKNGADLKSSETECFSMLHWASEINNFEIFQCLVDNGADVNVKDKYGCSILYKSAMLGKVHEVKYLLICGANFNIKMSGGYTVLHLVAERGNLDIAQCLLEHGADVNAKNNSGESVLRLAKISGNEGLIKYLIYHGARL